MTSTRPGRRSGRRSGLRRLLLPAVLRLPRALRLRALRMLPAGRLVPRLSLARQLLALQLGIVCLVLVGVAAVSVAQLDARYKDGEGRRALAVAERLAITAGVREAAASGGTAYLGQAQSVLDDGKTFSGSTSVALALVDRVVIVSTDPLPRSGSALVQETDGLRGRSWVGTQDGTGSAYAMAPVINVQTRATDGVVAVARAYPSPLDNLETALPNLLTYLGIASALGVVGSLLVARRVKRQTLGLEPREITGLVEQREALLHGIKEGVIAVDLGRRLTMVNDHAARMLGIPQLSIGRDVREVDPSGRLANVFGTGAPASDEQQTDRVLPVGDRLLILNRRPVVSHGRHIGWVVTLRDRTELLALQRELDLNRSTTEGLRAQAHEFSNRLHVVNGLIALGEFDGARSYIQQIANDQATVTTSVEDRVADPAVAALLVAKSSQAAERGVRFVIQPATRLGRLDTALAADVNTVVGNLVDNALEAAAAAPPEQGSPQVRVEVVGDEDIVVITVRDTGSGVDEGLGELVFARGFSTKVPGVSGSAPRGAVERGARGGAGGAAVGAAGALAASSDTGEASTGAAGGASATIVGSVAGEHGRGIGLALVRVVCRNRGGDVEVHNDEGAVFVAALPVVARAQAAREAGS